MTYPIELKDAYKGFTRDQDKFVSPEQTVALFRERLQTIDLDVLQETVRIDNGRLDIPVYFSICGKDAERLIGTKKQMGKGGTPSQAEASAVMELAERFSFFSFCKDPGNFFIDKYRNVEGRALSFEQIAKSVHEDPAEMERACEVFAGIPLQWTRAYNLTKGKEILVPFNWFFAINQFNGPSAGNCTEEAVLQGICEVVERHVSSVISRNRLKTPSIDCAPATDPIVRELLGKYRDAGVELYVTDFTLDTGIPSVGVLAYDPATWPEKSEIVWTAGTTPHPEKALSRALTEVAQLAGDFNTSSNYVASGLPKFRDLSEAGFVIGAEETVAISSLPDLSHDNMRVEAENCISALSKIGMDVILVDVRHPALDIPAFYTIVPGAHFRERAAGKSVGMFSAKLIAESEDPRWAIKELLGMDKILPDKYYVKFFLGQCHLAIHEPSKALDLLQEALLLAPHEQDIPTIYSYTAVALRDMERYSEALDSLGKAETYDPERTDVHNLKGYCYFKLGEHEKAIACFRRVLQLDPGSAIDYANIASNYRDMGDLKEAVRYYRFALELDPSLDFAKDNLAKLEQAAG